MVTLCMYVFTNSPRSQTPNHYKKKPSCIAETNLPCQGEHVTRMTHPLVPIAIRKSSPQTNSHRLSYAHTVRDVLFGWIDIQSHYPVTCVSSRLALAHVKQTKRNKTNTYNTACRLYCAVLYCSYFFPSLASGFPGFFNSSIGFSVFSLVEIDVGSGRSIYYRLISSQMNYINE